MHALGRSRIELSPLSPRKNGLSPVPVGTDFLNGDNGLRWFSWFVPSVPTKFERLPEADHANGRAGQARRTAGVGRLMHWSAWGRGVKKSTGSILETERVDRFLRAQVSGGGGTPRARWCVLSPGRPTLTRRRPRWHVSAQNHTLIPPAWWPPGATPGGPSWGGFPCPHAYPLEGGTLRGHETTGAPTF